MEQVVTQSGNFAPSRSEIQRMYRSYWFVGITRIYLEQCLRSLYGSRLYYTFTVVVTDNGSTDGSQEMLREKFSVRSNYPE